MVVNDFNVLGVRADPLEADAPLVVDAYAPPSFPVADKLLQPVARRHSQRLDFRRSRNHVELAQGDTRNGGETAIPAGFVQLARVLGP